MITMLYYNILPNSRITYLYIIVMKHIQNHSYMIYLIIKIKILLFLLFCGIPLNLCFLEEMNEVLRSWSSFLMESYCIFNLQIWSHAWGRESLQGLRKPHANYSDLLHGEIALNLKLINPLLILVVRARSSSLMEVV